MAETRRIALSDSLPDGRGRFVVGGQATQAASGEIKMYEWRKEVGQMGMIGLQTDVGQIRAMAWSPMPTHRYVVAAGLSTGRTVLFNLSPSTLALPAFTTTPSSSQFTIATLGVKHSRPATAIAFSPVDPNYLATGHDRHRSDYSLLIWDVADAMSRIQPDHPTAEWRRPLERLDITNPIAKDRRFLPTEPRPIQQYCPNETINSLCFLPSDIHSLLVGANSKAIRLYDLRVSDDQKSSGASPRDPSAGSGATAQWVGRAVNGLTADPHRGERFASYELNSNHCIVKVFDVRKPGVESVSFKVDGSVVALEWLGNGRLATGSRENGVSVWDIVNGRREDKAGGTEDWVTLGGMRQLITPKQTLHSFAFPSSSDGQKDVLVVGKDGTLSIGPITESPVLGSAARGDMVISASKLHIIDPEDEPSSQSRAHSPTLNGDAEAGDSDEDEKASLTFEDYKRQNRFQLAPEGVSRLLNEAGASVQGRPKSGLTSGNQTPRSTEKGARFGEMRDFVDEKQEIMGGFDGLGRILRGDVGYAMRCKAEEGYGLQNLHLNAAIATRFTGRDRLAGAWEFLNHLSTVMPPAMSIHRDTDLTHYGLYPLWLGLDLSRTYHDETRPSTSRHTTQHNSSTPSDLPMPSGNARRETVKQTSSAWSNVQRSPVQTVTTPRGSTTTSLALPTLEQEAQFKDVVQALNDKRAENGHAGSVGSGRMPYTEKEAQRRMMVVICGEGRDKAAISEVNRLIEDGQRTKAACWAFFSGEEEPAISILMNSDNEKHRLMASTIAGFLTQSRALRGSEFWNSHWPSLINKVDDPYIRAILLKIGGDNWESVLEEEAIPLLDRVAIAMFHLSDKDLTNFLKDRYTRCLRHASLHGLLLTGLTSLAIPLLQAYLDRTSDIQTVSLLSSFIPPSQLGKSERKQVDRWVEGYRNILDSWQMFAERCEFDVLRLERLRRLGGEGVRDDKRICPACNNQVGKIEEGHINRNSLLRATTTWPNERTTTCSLCTSVLPRCIICLLHVQPRFSDPWEDEPAVADTLDEAYVCCLTCRHGGHANHILPWFNGGLDGEPAHEKCAVAGCDCECANI